jgi:hypothetical protein
MALDHSTAAAGRLRDSPAPAPTPAPALAPAGAAVRRAGPIVIGSVVPFALIVFLALKQGGYDIVPRSQVALAVWWTVLLGAAAGVLPAARVTRAGWIALGLLAGFVVWTTLGIGWSSSSERSIAYLGLVAGYLGLFLLALVVQRRDAGRRVVNAVGAAIAFVAVLALLSRLHPSWFPPNPFGGREFAGARSRLNYPIGYWNGVAALTAMGIPLVLLAAARARTLVARGLAAAVVPAMALAAFYTFSRGGAIEIGVGIVVLVALFRRRLALLPTLAVDGIAAAILIAAALQRDALESGLGNGAAHSQGNEMLAMALVVCAGAGLVQVAIALAGRHRLGPRVRITRTQSLVVVGTAAVAAILFAVAAGVPHRLDNAWQEFKRPAIAAQATPAQRFGAATGNGRYQLWGAAGDENAANPLTGTGPGTFQLWWNQHGDIPVFVQNAHSLYLETLGELGIVGLLLIAGFIAWILARGTAGALSGWRGRRSRFAAITASGAAFATAAAFDWVWEIAVIPAAFLLLAAVVVGADSLDPRRHRSPRVGAGRLALRLGLVGAAVAATVVIAIPLAATTSVRASQADVRGHDLGAALAAARSAHGIEPYAASPLLQEAQVLELQGKLGAAAAAGAEATRAESTNWRTWLIASRIVAERGRAGAALVDYRRAHSLNPRSLLFETFDQFARLAEAGGQ